jgi:hypothetical protein
VWPDLASQPQTAGPNPSPNMTNATRPGLVPILAIAGVLLFGGGGFWIWSQIRHSQAHAAQREAALAATTAALTQRPVDADAIGRCVASLRKIVGFDDDRELRAAEAQLELARDRAEVAEERFVSLAAEPGASIAEQRLAARILLRRHEADLGDRAAGALANVFGYSSAAYQADRRPADLLRAWQAAERLGRSDDAKRCAADLARDHAGSAEHRFVAAAMAFGANTGIAEAEQSLAGLEDVPAEFAAMAAQAQLLAGDVPAAVRTVDAALARSPGLALVRTVAANVFHACALGSAAGSADRATWAARRDAQLDWLERLPDLADERRAFLRSLRDVR